MNGWNELPEGSEISCLFWKESISCPTCGIRHNSSNKLLETSPVSYSLNKPNICNAIGIIMILFLTLFYYPLCKVTSFAQRSFSSANLSVIVGIIAIIKFSWGGRGGGGESCLGNTSVTYFLFAMKLPSADSNNIS